MSPRAKSNSFFEVLRSERRRYDPKEIAELLHQVSQQRIEAMASALTEYIHVNLPKAFERRKGLADYRTNPYVLMTSATVMNLDSPKRFADFLANSKLYMALETSFGKSIENIFKYYPVVSEQRWSSPDEKIKEFAALGGLDREQKARLRTESVWREIDKSVVAGDRRYVTTIKSGPNTINDTQVQAMARAIMDHHRRWAQHSRDSFPGVKGLDIVIGLTYGTVRTTNNKENQILVKLLEQGFVEEDRDNRPGVLIDGATRTTRVYRRVGADFWAFMGNPQNPKAAGFVFLEVLLALQKALSTGIRDLKLEDRINSKMGELAKALAQFKFPRDVLPDWIHKDFTADDLFFFATAMTAFYDEGV